jgi:hypothetical protein
MTLEALLDEARAASPGGRIELRDRIAAYGIPAIDGVRPWLVDDQLSAFAVRVVERVGLDGEPVEAGRVLRSVRTKVPTNVQGDVEAALQRLKTASRAAPAQQAKQAGTPVPTPKREPPRYDAEKRRRAR